jgi:hypothetical protein
MKKKITTLHDKNNLTENKFIILYIARKLGVKLDCDQFYILTEKNNWMNYFDMRECIIDLKDAGFLIDDEGKYSITAQGIAVIDEFKRSIPFSIRTIIDNYAKENKSKILVEQQIIADYSQDSENEFPVLCRINENGVVIFETRIVAASAKDAQSLVDAFKKRASRIYVGVVKELTSDL